MCSSDLEAEVDAVINNDIFVNYYKNVFPKSQIIPPSKSGTLDESDVITFIELPITIQPNEHVALTFGKHVSEHFYTPLDLS